MPHTHRDNKIDSESMCVSCNGELWKHRNEIRRAGLDSVIDESECVNKRQTVRTNESRCNNEVLQRSANTATHTNIRYQSLVVLLMPYKQTHNTHTYILDAKGLACPTGEKCVYTFKLCYNLLIQITLTD